MRLIKILCLLLLVSSCAPIYVNYDYETNHDFSKYKTYNYYSDLETGLSAFDQKRLIAQLDEALNTQGFSVSDTPDFYINITSSQHEEVHRSSVSVGAGTGGRNVGGGISVGFPVGAAKMNRQIIIDFHDENGIGLFWQAVAQSTYNPNASPEKRETNLKAIVTKVLKGFPPKKQ